MLRKKKNTHYLRAVIGLKVRHVGVVDVKHVIANHLLPHSTGSLRHVQLELI